MGNTVISAEDRHLNLHLGRGCCGNNLLAESSGGDGVGSRVACGRMCGYAAVRRVGGGRAGRVRWLLFLRRSWRNNNPTY